MESPTRYGARIESMQDRSVVSNRWWLAIVSMLVSLQANSPAPAQQFPTQEPFGSPPPALTLVRPAPASFESGDSQSDKSGRLRRSPRAFGRSSARAAGAAARVDGERALKAYPEPARRRGSGNGGRRTRHRLPRVVGT